MPNIHAIGGCDSDCCGCEKIDYIGESSYWTQLEGSWTFSGFPLYQASISSAGKAVLADDGQGFDASVSPSKLCRYSGITGAWKIRWTVSTLSTGDQCGVVFSYQDEDNYWWLEYHQAAFGAADSVYIKRKIAGVDSTLYTYSSTTLNTPSILTYYPANDYTSARLRFEWVLVGDTAVPDLELTENITWGRVGLIVVATSGTVTYTALSVSKTSGASNTQSTPCVTRETCRTCRDVPGPVEVDVSWDDVANDLGCSPSNDCANLGNFAITAKRRVSTANAADCDWYTTFATYGTCRVRIAYGATASAYWDTAIITNGTEGGSTANMAASDDAYHTVQADADGIIDVEYQCTVPTSSWSELSRSLSFSWERRLHTDVADSQSVQVYYWDWCTNDWTTFGTPTFSIQSSTSADDATQNIFSLPSRVVGGDGVIRMRVYGTGLNTSTILYVDLARVLYASSAATLEVSLSFGSGVFIEACPGLVGSSRGITWSKV